MEQNKYLNIMFEWMYADFRSSIQESDGYKSLTQEQQQETNRWLNSDDGKNYFLNKLSRQDSETERTRMILDNVGLEGEMRNMIKTGLEKTFSKHIGNQLHNNEI